MWRIIYFLILLIIIQFPLVSKAQEKPFFTFTEDDGLANNNVFDITQDGRGYFWIATKDGLSKYNGQQFRNFHISDGLPANDVRAVAYDGQNYIYAACFHSGLAVIHINSVIKTLHVPGIVNDAYRRLYYSVKHQILFIGTDYGIFGLKDSTLFKLAEPNYPDDKSSVLAITEFEGIIYFTIQSQNDKGGFFKVDVNDIDFTRSKVTKIIGGGSAYGCTVMDNSIFVNLNSTIYKYLPHTGKVIEFAKTWKQLVPWSLAPIGPHKLGMGGWAESVYMPGIRVLDILTRKESPGSYNLRSPSVNNLIYDPYTKVNWVCSDIGLYCLYNSPFEVYNNIDKNRIKDFGIYNDSVYVITVDRLWHIIDGKWKLLCDRKHLDGIISRMQVLYILKKGNHKYPKNELRTLLNKEKPLVLRSLNADRNKIYLVTSRGTVSFPDMKTYLPIPHGSFISDEKDRTVWIQRNQPLRYFPSVLDSIDNFALDLLHENPLMNILKIQRKGDVFYCITSKNGLTTIKGKENSFLNPTNSKLDNYLTDIEMDNKGEVWCISSSGNLYHIGFDGKPVVNQLFNEKNSKIIGDNYKWLKFNKHYLYVGTNKGLNKIPINQLDSSKIDTVMFYNKFNGYDFLSADSPFSDSEGNIYVNTPDRIIKIVNENIDLPQLKIIIQNIWLNNQPITLQQLTGQSFSYTTKDITIVFSVLKLPNSGNIEFRYKVNDNWLEKGNTVILQSPKPGLYKIEFEAKNKETSRTYREFVSIRINGPFWLSWWFILLSVGAITLVFYWIFNSRFLRHKKETDEKSKLTMEIAELRILSLQSQMNPHFVFNSLNSIQSYILSNNMLDAATYLGTLGSIIRMNLESVSEEYISLSEEIKFLEKYSEIERLRFKDSLTLKILNKVHNSDNTFLPPMMIQPLIENSIKHGIRFSNRKGLIEVEFYMTDNMLTGTVTDNGIGRSRSAPNYGDQYKSLGIKLITKRLILMNEKNSTDMFQIHIEDLFENGNPKGTKVRIIIPQVIQKRIL